MRPQPPATPRDLNPRREIEGLRDRLRTLHADADHNQAVLARFQARELALLGAADLVELLGQMTGGMRRSFGVDAIRLLLFDPFLVIRDLLADTPETHGGPIPDIELCTDIDAVRARFDNLQTPWLGAWDEHRHLALFQALVWSAGG